MSGLRQKANPSKDEEFYRIWCLDHQVCQVCGIDARLAAIWRWPGLSTHHIVKPGRAHEACNLIRLCQRDHDLAEGRPWFGLIRGEKIEYQRLTIGMILTAKARSEPKDMDIQRLEELYGRMGLELEPLPQVLVDEWNDRKRATKASQVECWNKMQERLAKAR